MPRRRTAHPVEVPKRLILTISAVRRTGDSELTGIRYGPTVSFDTSSFSHLERREAMRSKVWTVVGTMMLGGLVISTPRAYAKCDVAGRRGRHRDCTRRRGGKL